MLEHKSRFDVAAEMSEVLRRYVDDSTTTGYAYVDYLRLACDDLESTINSIFGGRNGGENGENVLPVRSLNTAVNEWRKRHQDYLLVHDELTTSLQHYQNQAKDITLLLHKITGLVNIMGAIDHKLATVTKALDKTLYKENISNTKKVKPQKGAQE